MSAPSHHEETLFEQALGIEGPEAREEFLRQTCGDDAAMLAQLRELLAAHDRAGGFLEHKALADAGSRRSDEADSPRSPQGPPPHVGGYETPAVGAPSERPGDRIGRYKLLEQIGEGGMGTVWMAEQEEPVRRRVALKVIKLGMDTRQVLARFEAERQALALMDHPNIARVFDGGATGHPLPSDGRGAGGEGIPESEISNLKSEIPKGRPYFVMELVRGLPITKYCDQAKLSTRQRLELFGQVCRAVQHAHQKGIIHRDLKPSNILVTVQDDRPVVKVIDFGIAKATEGRLTDKTLFTGFQQLIGTPAYMSPEQASLGSLDIDTRSDTYSLGVVLYELLTGHPPFDTKELLKSGYEAVLRTIREVDPPKPSTRLTDLVAAGVSRRTPGQPDKSADSRRRLQEVRGDLDWIVMKCLEKDRARRYETANALALDLERHLHDEPVLARPPSTGYRLRKFVRKHRGPVMAAASFIVLLLATAAVSTGLALWANRERARATHATKAAQESESDTKAFSDFLVGDVLAAARPKGVQAGLGVNTTVGDALAIAERNLEERFAGRPRAEATARHAIGVTWRTLGKYDAAERHLRHALEIRERQLGAESLDTLDSRNSLGVVISAQGRHADAIALHTRNLEAYQRVRGLDDPLTLTTMNNLAAAYRDAGRSADALALFDQVLKLRTAQRGVDHEETLHSMNNLALAYIDAGRPADGLRLLGQLVTMSKTNRGPDHPDTLQAMANLAGACQSAGRLPDAILLLEQSLDLRRKKLSPSHPDTLISMNQLGEAYAQDGRIEKALPLFEASLQGLKTNPGPDHPDTLTAMNNAGRAYHQAGLLPKALPLLEEAWNRSKDRLGARDPRTLVSMNNLALAYQDADRLRDALPMFEECLKLRREVFGQNNPRTLPSMNNLAAAYRKAGWFDKALPLFEETVKLCKEHFEPRHRRTLASMNNLGQTYLLAGRTADAIFMLEETLRHRQDKLGFDNSETLLTMQDLAEAYSATNRLGDAEKQLRELVERTRRNRSPESRTLADRLLRLSTCLLSQKQFENAEPLLRDSLTILEKQEPGRSATFQAQSLLGWSLLGQQNFADAEPLLVEAYEGLKQRSEQQSSNSRARLVKQAGERVVQLYEAWGKPDLAAQWREKMSAPAKPGTNDQL